MASFDNDKVEDKLESIIGNKNIRVAVLARNLESKLSIPPAIPETTNKLTEANRCRA